MCLKSYSDFNAEICMFRNISVFQTIALYAILYKATTGDFIMNKQDIYARLNEKQLWHEITEHQAVYHMDDFSGVELPYPEADAKSLFIRDDKKQNYYLLTVPGSKRVDLKAFRKAQGTRPLSFASADDLMAIMKLIPGAVTPFGVLNDETRRVKVFLDSGFLKHDGLIGIHPNDNTATVWMKTLDLAELLKEHGNEVYVTKL